MLFCQFCGHDETEHGDAALALRQPSMKGTLIADEREHTECWVRHCQCDTFMAPAVLADSEWIAS